MARGWRGLLLLVVPAAAWAQDSPATHQGRTAAEWVDRLVEGDEEASRAVQAMGAPCVRLILERLAAGNVSDDRLEGAVEEMGAQAAPILLGQLRTGKPQVRLLALRFLLRDPPAELGKLVPELLRNTDREVRAGTALQLCELGFDAVEALPPLLEALQSQEHRAWAASLLWLFPQEGTRVVPALITATRDPDGDVRRAALASLGAFWAANQDARARILEASESKDASDRVGAVTAWTGVRPATPDIVALTLRAAEDPDTAVRAKALDALRQFWRRGKLGDSVNQALSHPQAEVRELACESVAVGETTALAPVLARLEDGHEDVRIAALDAIARIGDSGPAVRGRLRELLAEGRTMTGQRAAWTLIALDVEIDQAAALLVDAWKALDVAAVLGKRATAAVPALREMLDEEQPGDAAWALYVVTGEIEAPLGALRREMEHGDWYARVRACITAARFGPAAAALAPVLTRLLADEDSGVRRHAATALGYIGPASRPAIPKLIELLDDHEDRDLAPTHHVCRHAAAALAWLDVDSPEVKDLLGKVMDVRDPNDGSTRPGALRYYWKHGLMPVEEVVSRCAESLNPPNWGDILPVVRLLGEIGAPARSALPALEPLMRRPYLRMTVEEATRRIRPPD